MNVTVPHYVHNHPPIRNVNDVHAEGLSMGQRTADAFASLIGSWRFIIVQSILLMIWMALNLAAWVNHWDPYPFILLNLVLSFQAAFAGPIIMMSQNRQTEKDRIAAQLDYEINVKARGRDQGDPGAHRGHRRLYPRTADALQGRRGTAGGQDLGETRPVGRHQTGRVSAGATTGSRAQRRPSHLC